MDLKVLGKYYPDEMEIFEKTINDSSDIPFVLSGEIHWKEGVSIEDKALAEAAIKRIQEKNASLTPEERNERFAPYQTLELEMLNDAFEASRRGENVILDVLDIDTLAQEMLRTNFNGPLRPVLTYCPFHVLSDRMEKRNKEAIESGNLDNQRIGTFPLQQFSEIYTKKIEGQVAFESLNRNQVKKTFEENFNKRVEADRANGLKIPSENEIKKNKRELLAELLEKLGFEDGIDRVQVAPRDQHLYREIIDSSKLLPGQSAIIIHGGTNDRYRM